MTPRRSLLKPLSEPLSLTSEDVHVWSAALDQNDLTVAPLFHTLAPDERGRAARFVFPRDRIHFIVARGVLRNILGRYLQTKPERLLFARGPNGKPALLSDVGENPVRFNLSHSNGVALYAVSIRRELGVDIEYVREGIDYLQIASRFFSAPEIARLRALPPHAQLTGFYNCWTRKEAYVKAEGGGLSIPLDQFDASGARVRLLGAEGEAAAAEERGWSLQELSTGPDFAAALTAQGGGWRLSYRQWTSADILDE